MIGQGGGVKPQSHYPIATTNNNVSKLSAEFVQNYHRHESKGFDSKMPENTGRV